MSMNKALVREIDAMIENLLDSIKKLRNMRKLVVISYGPEVKPKKPVLPVYAFIEEPVLPVYAFIEEPVPEQKLQFYVAEIINQAVVSKKVRTKILHNERVEIIKPEPVYTSCGPINEPPPPYDGVFDSEPVLPDYSIPFCDPPPYDNINKVEIRVKTKYGAKQITTLWGYNSPAASGLYWY